MTFESTDGATLGAYPLQWPAGKPRTESPQPSRFGTNTWDKSRRVTLGRAIRELHEELDRLGAVNEVVSTNLKLRNDGLPRASQRAPDDPGVAVYFQIYDADRRAYDDVCLTCDRWNKIACNIWSITKSIEALRGLERWGGGDMVRAAFTGFIALPEPAAKPWWAVLGFHSEADALAGDFETAARKLMQQHHPDTGDGDAWQFDQVRKARDSGRDAKRTN